MAFLAAAPALAAGFGAGAAATGAGLTGVAALGTGVSGAAGLFGFSTSTLLQGAGTALSGFSTITQYLTAQKVAEENAKRAAESARIEAERAQIEQQDQDFVARLAAGAEIAAQAGSGFALDSPSFAFARKQTQIISRTNSERLREDSSLVIRNIFSGAADALTAAGQARRAGLLSVAETGLNLGSVFVNEGTTVAKRKLQSLGIV